MGSRLRLAAIAVGVVLALTGCSGQSNSSTGKQTVVFWEFNTGQPTLDAWHKTITAFEAKFPNISVDMQVVPWTEQSQKLATALVSGGLPDVSFMGNDVVTQYAAQNALAPLDSYVPKWSNQEGQDVSKDFWPGDVLYYTYKGKFYGAPMIDETRVLYYRADLFQKAGLDPSKAPASWDEMAADAAKLTAGGVYGWGLPQSKDYITVQTFMSVYLSYGARMLDQSGQACGFNSPEFQQALTYYTDIYKNKLTPPDSVSWTYDQATSAFVSGKTAMYIYTLDPYEKLKESNSPLLANVKVSAIPSGPKGQFGFLGGVPLVMWNASTHKDAAAEFMHFATSPNGGLGDVSIGMGALPGRHSVATGTQPFNTYPYSVVSDGLSHAYPYQYPSPAIPQMGKIETETIQDSVQRVSSGQMNVAQSTAQLCSDINSELKS